MDFQLSEDQEALQAGVRSFCEGRVAAERLPELDETGFDRALWGELAEMGVFNLRLSEEDGGVGLKTADAALVFAELGRRLVPGPLVWSHLGAGVVDGAAEGKTVVGGIDLAGALREPVLVEHFDATDVFLVLRPDGLYRVDANTLSGEPVATPLDPHTPLHHVRSLPQGEKLAGAERVQALRLEGAALVSAQLLGIAEATQELATEYAREREQFGRAIGSFQAIKHLLSDMWVRVEVARAAVYAAAATLDDPEVGDVARAVSSAKLMASAGALRNARACIQVHGGMGYTWEVPAHRYLKRTWVLDSLFGTNDEHAERVAERVAAGH